MTRMLFFSAGATLVGLSLASRADSADMADPLAQRIAVHARTVSADDFAFTRTVKIEQIEGAETKHLVVVDRWDPTKPKAEHWTLVTLDGRAPTANEAAQHRTESASRRVAYYGRVADYFAAAPVASQDAKGRTLFSFPRFPEGALMIGKSDLSSSASGEATVDASGPVPFLELVRFTLKKPVRLKLVAKIERMDAWTRYRMMPNGKPAPVEQASDMSGSMLGHEGRVRTTISYTDLRAAR